METEEMRQARIAMENFKIQAYINQLHEELTAPLPKKEDVMASRARYEMTEDGHNKFWEIESNSPTTVVATWGKIGKDPQGEKEYPIDGIEKLIKEKLKKGYVLVSHS